MKKLAFALLLSTFAASAFAANSGFYGALDLGQTKAKDACDTTGAPAGSTFAGCKDTANMYRIVGGYQITPMWGAEVSYGDYGKASLGTAVVPGTGTLILGDWKLSGLQLSGTGTFPLGNAFALIGKVGIARTDINIAATSRSATSTKLSYGIGAQYDLTNSVAVRAQYENLGTVGDTNTTGTAKVSLLSAGFVFKF